MTQPTQAELNRMRMIIKAVTSSLVTSDNVQSYVALMEILKDDRMCKSIHHYLMNKDVSDFEPKRDISKKQRDKVEQNFIKLQLQELIKKLESEK
jgi:adenine C2-methylase RlmN of 23S rRNA A2503 and tRNA A37